MLFTDLDGTLLEHADYSFDAALPALKVLERAQVPVVIATSKTAAEVASLREALGLGQWPAIVENGAAILRPGETASTGTTDYTRLRAALDTLPPDLRVRFRGFADMEAREVAGITGLDPDAAIRAKARAATEPGLFDGDEEDERRFIDALAMSGIAARRGGRFLTLSFGGTKAERMKDLADAAGADVTIALGDAPNDIEMIEAATHGVIVRNDHGTGLPRLAGEDTGRIRRTALPGPAGWNEAVLDLLSELGLEGARTDG